MTAYVITLHTFYGSMGEAAWPIHAVAVQGSEERVKELSNAIFAEINDEEVLVAVTPMDDSQLGLSAAEIVTQFKAAYNEAYGEMYDN